jgi:hypothetical protein
LGYIVDIESAAPTNPIIAHKKYISCTGVASPRVEKELNKLGTTKIRKRGLSMRSVVRPNVDRQCLMPFPSMNTPTMERYGKSTVKSP